MNPALSPDRFPAVLVRPSEVPAMARECAAPSEFTSLSVACRLSALVRDHGATAGGARQRGAAILRRLAGQVEVAGRVHGRAAS